MQCPYCNISTRQLERSGLLLETCPTCKGAWLEAVDLERVLAIADGRAERAVTAGRRRDYDSDDHDHRVPDARSRHGAYDSDDDVHGQGYGRHGRKRGLARLLDLFD